MRVKQIIDEDFTNYKKPSMFIAFPTCSFKCGKGYCHNAELVDMPDITVTPQDIVNRYKRNNLTSAIVCGGLEPMDNLPSLYLLIAAIREENITDDIVVYTGYTESETTNCGLELLSRYPNVIVKFGGYIPNQKPHYDDVLGIMLASDNQYAKKIS